MSLAKLAPVNGALTVAGVGGDFARFRLRASQQVDNTTGYTETTDADHSGSGVREWNLNFGGFCTKGVSGTTLGMASFTGGAAAVVATLDSSITYTGSFVLESLEVTHQKIAGAVPFEGTALNKGAVVEAWVVA